MKGQYERQTRYFLPRRTYTIVRVDGKAFHSLLRGRPRPFDEFFAEVMDATAEAMCREIQGAEFAYVQSDEISVLLTDFAKESTDAWFDGNVQKMASIAAALATSWFTAGWVGNARPLFDARVFTIPDPVEVENYFVWRQQDATRNSIAMAAQAVYSHGQLHGKNTSEMQDMLHAKGVNWNDYPVGFKRGRVVRYLDAEPGGVWMIDMQPPIFTADRDYLRRLIPRFGYGRDDPNGGTP